LALTGFAYVADAESGPMAAAAAGAKVRNPDGGPPWIVVDHGLESIVVSKWPGKLWKVEILKAAKEQPNESANYTRAVAVRVIEELPPAVLFGPHGDAVLEVIERARSATLRHALHPEAREIYSRAWNRWLGTSHQDHRDTLAVSPGRSPIGAGFTVIYSVLSSRATFVVDDDGDATLTPEWAAVADAFLHAAMAVGAPELLSPSEVEILSHGYS